MYRHVEKLAQEIRKGAASVDMVLLLLIWCRCQTMAGQSVLSYWRFYGEYLTILGYNETHKLIMKSLKQNRS